MTSRCASILEAPGSTVFSPEVAQCIHAKGHSGDHEGYYGIWGRTKWNNKVSQIHINPTIYPSQAQWPPPFPDGRSVSVWQIMGGILALAFIAGPSLWWLL